MLSNRRRRKVLHGQLIGQRSNGGQNKHYKDYVKVCLKKCNIPLSEIQNWKPLLQTEIPGGQPAKTVWQHCWRPQIKLQRTVTQEDMLFLTPLPSDPAVLPATESVPPNLDFGVISTVTTWSPVAQRRRRLRRTTASKQEACVRCKSRGQSLLSAIACVILQSSGFFSGFVFIWTPLDYMTDQY